MQLQRVLNNTNSLTQNKKRIKIPANKMHSQKKLPHFQILLRNCFCRKNIQNSWNEKNFEYINSFCLQTIKILYWIVLPRVYLHFFLTNYLRTRQKVNFRLWNSNIWKIFEFDDKDIFGNQNRFLLSHT